MRLAWITLLVCASAQMSTAQEAEGEGEAFDLLPYPAISQEIHRLGAEHDIVTRHILGTTRGGRELEALEIAAPERESHWPAILVVANLEGPRAFESALVLDQVERLVAGWESGDEAVRELLSSTVLYFIPCANPDAAAGREEQPRAERLSGGHGIDDDRDGRQGEDPPSDVNGDGLITWMRVPDPEGTWRADETDDRALVEADRNKGERGTWKLYREGRDLDGDGRVSEDAPHDARLNQTFPAGWQEHTAAGGQFPSDEPETRALMEFVLQHRNLQLVLTYDALDSLVEKPKSVKDNARPVHRVPPPGVLESDAALIEEIGRRYRETTGSEVKGEGEANGSFQKWCYEHRGLWTLSARLWEMPEEDPPAPEEESTEAEGESAEEGAEEAPAAKPEKPEKKSKAKPSTDAKRLAWIDANPDEAWRFAAWTAFEHPELGAVEIGGFTPYGFYDPPKDARAGIADAQFEFLTGLGALLPRISLSECSAEFLGGGVWRVEAVLQNDAFLPLLSRSARRTRTTRPARLRLLLPDAGTILAGSEQTLVSELDGSGGRREFTWLVRGPEGMEIAVNVDTDHAGEVRRVAEVKP